MSEITSQLLYIAYSNRGIGVEVNKDEVAVTDEIVEIRTKELQADLDKVTESRDELLEELKLARDGYKTVLIDSVIQKAEAQKEKETK